LQPSLCSVLLNHFLPAATATPPSPARIESSVRHRDAAFWEQPEGAAPSPWAMAWRKAGYEIDTFRLARDGGWVRFKRTA
jgi:hypothetical protein